MVASTSSQPKSPTLGFLQLCLLSGWDSEAQIEVANILQTGGVNWQEFLYEVSAASLGPVVFLAIKDLPGVPSNIKTDLHKQYLDSGVNAALLTRELTQLLQLMNQNDIDIILLKGIGLLYQLYENPAMRPMQDMDLLIDPKKAPIALQLIQEMGYSLVKTDLRSGFTLQFENEVVLQKPGPLDIFLDLHWYLFDSPYYQNSNSSVWFIQSALPVTVGTESARVLDTEPLILYLSGHLALHHGSKDWIWMLDLAYIINLHQGRMDWSLLLAKAQELELVLPLQSTLPELKIAWRVPVPDEVLMQLENLKPSAKEVDMARQAMVHARGSGKRFIDDIRAFDDPEEKNRFIFQRVFPSPDYMIRRYKIRNKVALPAYYLYRWFLGIKSSF